MTELEVLLIVLGFIFIGLSFFLSEKNEVKTENENIPQTGGAELWSEKDESIIKSRISDIMSEQSENIVEETKDRLNQISNEKIMTVDEFSNQLLEKIDHNHKEVVFMYNMLNEKEKDLKKLAAVRPVPKPEAEISAVAGERREIPLQEPVPALKKPKPAPEKKPVPQKAKPPVKPENRLAPESEAVKGMVVSPDDGVVVQEVLSSDKVTYGSDTNMKIKEMYRSGKSILEISKELGMGQGEVKLVVDLYGGRR